jgi:hypothetical protein
MNLPLLEGAKYLKSDTYTRYMRRTDDVSMT